jgi:hypothetical protein
MGLTFEYLRMILDVNLYLNRFFFKQTIFTEAVLQFNFAYAEKQKK